MKTDKLYLAADSGGSKTVWTLLTAQGEEVFAYTTAGLGAVQAGILPVEETVAEAAEVLNKIGVPAGIHLSLGGPNTAEVTAALERAWADTPVRVEREACGDSILLAAGFFGCSAAVMCGTGSTAVGEKESGRCFSGGWGPIYGDGGSGGGLGSEALRLFLRSVDGFADMGKTASLFSSLTEGLDIGSFAGRMELKSRALAMSRKELAALAPKIYELKLQGDPTAIALYSEAAEEVASMACAVSRNEENTGVLLCGGFFAQKEAFVEECKERFAKKSKAQLKYMEDFAPIVGVQLSVLKNNSVELTDSIFQTVLQNRKNR